MGKEKGMENIVIQKRIAGLRAAMAENGVDFYLIPTADFHNSEYVSDYFKVREFFSGFTGSNGTLLVWKEGAGLWTDGRYFIQAEKELEGSGITLYRMGEEKTPSIREFLLENMQEKQTLGFDGRVVNAAEGLLLERALQNKQITVAYEKDLANTVWQDRPALPCSQIFVIPRKISGEDTEDKLKKVRMGIEEAAADSLFLTKLDDLMWLFNIRGKDVECNPVALSYGYISRERVVLFMQKGALNKEAEAYLSENHVELRDYGEAEVFLEKETAERERILMDNRHCSFAFYKKADSAASVIEGRNPTELLKAVKNQTELANMEAVYLADSVAVTKFIYWLKHTIGRQEITEVSAAAYLDNLRRRIPGFLDLSFPTISAYKENAAMMHYEATETQHKVLEKEGMLLVDSGGQYLGGTTDVTRTIVLGDISDEVKVHYTAVVTGMLALANAKWLYGCTGRNLDILARLPLWKLGIDYKCGTGHGVGYILNVHEGPQNIRWRYVEGVPEAIIEAGMDVTDEPGVYIEGTHGVRIENVLVAKNGEKNMDGQFMFFDTLTFVPIDREAISVTCLSDETREQLNAYHKMVYEKISPYLEPEEKQWLKAVTEFI